MYKCGVYDYDVWGNDVDGYEVNEETLIWDDVPLADLEDNTIVEALIDCGYLLPEVDREKLEIVDLYPRMEVEYEGRPVGCALIKEV